MPCCQRAGRLRLPAIPVGGTFRLNGGTQGLAMAVHGNRRSKLRQAARNALSLVRERSHGASQRPGTDRKHARDSDADRIDRRLSEIAAEVRAGKLYQVPWELFRSVALPQAPDKQAAVMLAAWCAASKLTPRLEVRTVAIGDFQRRVIYLLLSSDR